jgi:flagellar biosynthesis protein FlhA
VRPLLDEDGGLHVVTLDSSMEDELSRTFTPPSAAPAPAVLQPSLVRRLLEGMRRLAGGTGVGHQPSAPVFHAGTFSSEAALEPFMPKLVVLSPGEIPPAISVQSVGVLR